MNARFKVRGPSAMRYPVLGIRTPSGAEAPALTLMRDFKAKAKVKAK